ncbi:hypothetical protein M426DRAFT_324192 [Hypoxylon sp. CI-4A]|nr:hypothetical protein M426DRAFT_324192 [Hypoxylon sp. CI-4A]
MSFANNLNEQPPSKMEKYGLIESPFEGEYPTEDNRVYEFDPSVIRSDAQATRIVLHPRWPGLCGKFLDHKRKHGSDIEKTLYKDWAWWDLTRRLLSQRAMTFLNAQDDTLYRNGQYARNQAKFWDGVGKQGEAYKLLEDNLSYDEIMLGSLIAVSGPSYFINDGNRYNNGKKGKPGTYEERGIIIGLVGPRFERPEHMDSTYILGKTTTKQHPELTQLFRDFFGSEPVTEQGRAEFDHAAYHSRIRISADMLFLEAETRAREAKKRAYVYVVGLGLGVWKRDAMQPTIYIQAFLAALYDLKDKLRSIATVEFAYIDVNQAMREAITAVAAKQGINVKFSKRQPAAKLTGEEANQLLVLSYAWDGNAFPGNEYWIGSLSGSGDPAAAAMSTIPDLHNVLVNPYIIGPPMNYQGYHEL